MGAIVQTASDAPRDSLPMRLVERMAAWVGAPRLIPITRAHVDGCLYHGPASLDFARTLAESGATVQVPTTLNVSIIDLLHPELFRGPPEVAAAGREMMRHYTAMGCRETWTCAPYQLDERPAFGEQIAWAESNAIVFANSVLGARTERYGDFIDICAAITGHVPEYGLHTDEGRLGTVLVEVRGVPEAAMRRGHVLRPRSATWSGGSPGRPSPSSMASRAPRRTSSRPSERRLHRRVPWPCSTWSA